MIPLNITEIVDWSRAQFALTAMYHWLFVPLTLGLGIICAVMETVYLRKGFPPEWKKTVRFWMRLFGINFAIGVATGLILEFEFGTNWSNYSYFVGDIFGAPLAIEGIVAFFMEATFIAVMFFGWDKVSPRFHLASTWLVAIGASLSAYWILVANSWMQYPVGMSFNLETARNEMTDFAQVAFSPVAVTKFIHSVSSGLVTAALFVCGISAWYMLRKREAFLAARSLRIGAVTGLIGSLLVAWSGDNSGVQVARIQPMKLAAMEAIYKGQTGAPLTVISLLNPAKRIDNDEPIHYAPVRIDGMLSLLAAHRSDAFVPGIEDLVYGNAAHGILSTRDKMERGEEARTQMARYVEARKTGDTATMRQVQRLFDTRTEEGRQFHDTYFRYLGYGYLDHPEEVIPNIPLTYYSFRVMVGLGVYFILLFAVVLWLGRKPLEGRKFLLRLLVWSIPLGYLAGQAGWIVCEVGRQPWTIQDLLPTGVSVSSLDAASVQTTFFLFAVLFTLLLIAEIRIMLKQIRIGSER